MPRNNQPQHLETVIRSNDAGELYWNKYQYDMEKLRWSMLYQLRNYAYSGTLKWNENYAYKKL